MYDVFERLMIERKLNIAEVSRGSGVPYITFTDWRAGRYTPKEDKMKKIADFFDVSVDYLKTGRDDNEFISRREQALLDMFRKLNDDGKEQLELMARLFSDRPEYQKGQKSLGSNVG